MKKIIVGICTSSFLFAANFMPYGAYLTYNNSTKDSGYVGGIYASDLESPYKLEFDAEYLDITYNNGSPDYTESDITLIGHYYEGYNYDYKLGIHNIFVTQTGNKAYNQVFIGGILYYKTLQYNYGADLYISSYDNFSVYQITPKAGYNFGNYYSFLGSFYVEGKFNFINISNKGYAPHQDYRNLDFKVSNYNGPYVTTIEASFGKNAYKVASDGYSVYNLGEEYEKSYTARFKYKFDKTDSFEVSYSRSFFTENNINASSKVYLLSYVTMF